MLYSVSELSLLLQLMRERRCVCYLMYNNEHGNWPCWPFLVNVGTKVKIRLDRSNRPSLFLPFLLLLSFKSRVGISKIDFPVHFPDKSPAATANTHTSIHPILENRRAAAAANPIRSRIHIKKGEKKKAASYV